MGKEVGDEFVSGAIKYAKERWCLDDEVIVREWCKCRTDSDAPESLIDAFAADYDLIDPQDEAGAALAAKRLLEEYTEEFGELREAFLAHRPPRGRK